MVYNDLAPIVSRLFRLPAAIVFLHGVQPAVSRRLTLPFVVWSAFVSRQPSSPYSHRFLVLLSSGRLWLWHPRHAATYSITVWLLYSAPLALLRQDNEEVD